MIYFNPLLSHFYFRFQNTNGCNIEILLNDCSLSISVCYDALYRPNTTKYRETILYITISNYRNSNMASTTILNLQYSVATRLRSCVGL